MEPKEPILRFFEYNHLPEHLQAVSKPFHALAHGTIMKQPRSAERTVALRHLLDAMTAVQRAAMPDPDAVV